jgi:hypothetical protein
MSENIEKLLVRNLHEVFGERDGNRRRAAIAQIYTEDCIFEDHFGQNVGHAAIDASAESLQRKMPTHVFSEAGPVQSLHLSARLPWRLGPPEEPARITGVDFVIVRGERIAALYVFLDEPPA